MMQRNSNISVSLALAAAVAVAGCETVVEQVADTYHARLTGGQEVPGPGDADGAAKAEVSIADRIDNLCYEIDEVSGIVTPTAAHIHRGAAGVAGPPVVTLDVPTDGESTGCVKVAEALADEIEANPANFYVNIHNAEYPAGAIRGQLGK